MNVVESTKCCVRNKQTNHVIVHLYTHEIFFSFNVQVPHRAVAPCRIFQLPPIYIKMEYTPVELEAMISRLDEKVQNGIMDGQIDNVIAEISTELVSS